MPRFVVLEHDGPKGTHWDFMLETGAVLATWSLPQPPDAASPQTAEALPDHRPAYLEYEGPISGGRGSISGGRGSVSRWDRGTYCVERQSATELAVALSGEKLRGRALLEQPPDAPGQWRFSFVAD